MSLIVAHGIHTHGGATQAFGELLAKKGHKVRHWAYPKRWALGMYFPGRARKDGAALANFMRNGDSIVAHSNGALAWQNSILAGAKWNKCFIFGGAATSDKFIYPADSLKEAYIIYNPEDLALWAGSLLPFHPFGKLGYRGYAGKKDSRFINVNGFSDKFARLNHSHYFTPEVRERWLDYVDSQMKNATG